MKFFFPIRIKPNKVQQAAESRNVAHQSGQPKTGTKEFYWRSVSEINLQFLPRPFEFFNGWKNNDIKFSGYVFPPFSCTKRIESAYIGIPMKLSNFIFPTAWKEMWKNQEKLTI